MANDLTKKLHDSIPGIKKKMRFYDLDRVKLEIQEEVALAKRVEINMDLMHWKRKFLFPYAPIAPLPDPEMPKALLTGVSESDRTFNRLISKKYMFPADRHMMRRELLDELQNPLAVTADEIMKDLLKFVKDFPVDVVPHMNEEEKAAYNTMIKMYRYHRKPPASPEKTPAKVQPIREALEGDEAPPQSPQGIFHINPKMLKPLHFGKHQITSFDILHAFKEIEHEETGRLVGLVAHFVYWVVFGHLNESPLNQFHLKQLFISILQCVT